MSTVLAIAYARVVAREQNRRPMRLARELDAGAVELLRVRVVADDGERGSIGSSLEHAPGVSASPKLVTDEVVLEEVGGQAPRRLRLPPGEDLKVVHLPGAIRQSLRLETTEGGIAQRFSFELPEAQPFTLAARVGPRGEPYRDDAVLLLEAPDGGFSVAAEPDQLTEPSFRFGQAALVAVAVFALLSAASTVFRFGWFRGMAISVALYTAFGWWLRARAASARDDQDVEERARLRVPPAPARVASSDAEGERERAAAQEQQAAEELHEAMISSRREPHLPA